MLQVFTTTLGILLVLTAEAQPNYQPTAENLKARREFQDARFGMMVHWGIYSSLAGGGETMEAEKIMDLKKIPIKDYEQVASFFNPAQFNAEAWVLIAKKAGCKYITFAAKHMDGFAMFDSKVSDYDVTDRTPFKRDPVKELADACRKHGLKLFLFYSQLDWHHPDYFPRGRTGVSPGRPDKGNWQHYLEYQNAQITELLTNYGPVGGVWLNGMWDKKSLPNGGDWQLDQTYRLIHQLQPQALLANNHHVSPYPGEDFQLFQIHPPDATKPEMAHVMKPLPYETFDSFSPSWGYNLIDKKFKTRTQIVHSIVKAAGAGSNFLLNVAPMPNGLIPAAVQDTLLQVGTWLNIYGSTVYGTKAGPVKPQSWGVTTQKQNKIFVHILQSAQSNSVMLPGFNTPFKASWFINGKQVKSKRTKAGTKLYITGSNNKELDNIIVLTTR